jgi:predicted nuclease of predicted toxin-antitoxin system
MLRFLADADLKRAIVSGVKRREPGIDFRSAQAVALEGVEDAEVLAIASREGRILVSHDYGTMPRHFRDFVSGQPSPGVFLIPQDVPVGAAVEMLVLIWAASDAVEWKNQLTISRYKLATKPRLPPGSNIDASDDNSCHVSDNSSHTMLPVERGRHWPTRSDRPTAMPLPGVADGGGLE